MRRRHHTFEAKLRNASTLLRLGKTKKSCFALTLIAKFSFQFSLYKICVADTILFSFQFSVFTSYARSAPHF